MAELAEEEEVKFPFKAVARFILQMIRWALVTVLWFTTLGFFLLGMGKFARIFTGDEQFGALDGFQFIDALYGAVVRWIAAVLVGYLVWRLLRWRPLFDGSDDEDWDDEECDDEEGEPREETTEAAEISFDS